MKNKSWNIGNGWKRVNTRAGFRYFHDGKFTSEEKFQSAFKQRLKKRSEPEKKKPGKRKAEKPEKGKTRRTFQMCKLADRAALFEQIKSDRASLQKTLSAEDFSELRVVIEIDPVTKNKRSKDRQKKDRNRGHRRFTSLRKLKNFLGLNYKYTEDGLKEPVDWTKRGVCKYRKRGYMSVTRSKGERITGERILRQYEFPFV